MQQNDARIRSRRAGFSLIELLVVIAILVILIALTFAVATGINTSSRNRAAADTIRVLDQSVEAWVGATGGRVPRNFTDSAGNVYEAIDGRPDIPDNFGAEARPSLGIYIEAISADDSASGIVRSIDSTFRGLESFGLEAGNIELTAIRDPWGNLYRFVHPYFQGGSGDYWSVPAGSMVGRDSVVGGASNNLDQDYRRSWRPFNPNTTDPSINPVGDADEGICPGGGTRPYFYSAGASGDPGNTKDNIYSERPQFPNETDPVRVRRE